MKKTMLTVLAAAAALAFPLGAAAQDWPQRPIQWVVPFSAGGPADIFARAIQPKLSQALGQPVIIENKAGAQSNIGHAAVARAEPDGYTILYVVPNIVTNPSLFKNMVDPLKELAPVTRITSQSYVLVARKDLEPKSLGEIIGQAKARPGGLTCASGGGLMTFGCEWLKTTTRANFIHVQYKGNAPAMKDLLAGRVDILFDLFNTSLPQIRAGRIRPVALTGSNPGEPLPQLPTIAQTLPGFVLEGWHGVMAPVGLPRPVLDKLNSAFRTALADPEVAKRITDAYSEVAPTTPEEFGRILREDYAKYAQIVKDAGIKAE
ncbi:MAG TPA: tripartite tricarboxylate transporter substrate binding protein [Burkholderiales bacterium]|nr:tripartite tricarboxylate transporter substrate binding protein [Burkholderiales bacterium]